MSYQNILSVKSDLDRMNHIITTPIGDMFAKPIQNGLLNRSTLIKGLDNMRIYEENYYCFTDLTLNDLDLKNISIISDYKSLKKLILQRNSLKDLNALNSLNELEYLDVAHNCLEQILNFDPPKVLYHVDFSYNNVKHMSDLTNFWSLVYLNLSYNAITVVKGLLKLKFLKYLNLSHNRIKQIDHSLPYSCEEINLSHNDLDRVQFDMSLSMCEVLDVSYNQLKFINFLKNAKQLSVLNIQNNMIDDILQIEHLKSIPTLHTVNAENNKFIGMNIHEQIFLNNMPLKTIIDQTFIKTEDLQDLNKSDVYSILTAKKNAIKSTVMEQLSQVSPLSGSDCDSYSCHRLLPMVILVGPIKTRKKYILNQIFLKHADKFYRSCIYTTNNKCKNRIFKTITIQEFNHMNCTGKFVFSYRFLGNSYALSEDELTKCIKENKVLISFSNLEGALHLKLKGYKPTFVLVLPKDKSFYEKNIYQNIEKYMDQSKLLSENDLLNEKIFWQNLNTTNENTSSTNKDDFNQESFAVCSKASTNDTIKIISQNNFEDDFNDPNLNDSRVVFTNECMNSLNICLNIYEKSTGIFHSLVYVDDYQYALKEITKIMVDVYHNNKREITQSSGAQKQPNEHTLEHIQHRQKQLYDELFE